MAKQSKDMDDHANESLLFANEWPETLMIVVECNWTLEIMQKSLLKVYSLKWMHRGVNERVFALLIVDRRKWMRILR